MLTGEKNPTARGSEGPLLNLPLLKLVCHEMGNGLAILSGYRHLLQRSITLQAGEAVPPEPEVWQQRNEQWLGYLRAMHDRETLLNDFLAQLRGLSPGELPEHFCQNFGRADLRMIVGGVIERLAPLFPAQTLNVHMPSQPLFIRCDAFWLEVALEHIISHTIAVHTASTPIEINLEQSNGLTHLVQEARVTLQIKRAHPTPLPESTKPSGPWPGDLEICFGMCRVVFQEHGGLVWWEQGAEQTEVLYLTLPLVE